MVRRGWEAAKWVADGEDTQPAEGVEGEEDEDGEGYKGEHNFPLQSPQVQLCDDNIGIQVRNPARILGTNLAKL